MPAIAMRREDSPARFANGTPLEVRISPTSGYRFAGRKTFFRSACAPRDYLEVMSTVRILGFVIVLLLGDTAAAQHRDALLDTIDELIASSRCVEAMALLPHARGTPASLMGRRALCGMRTGEPDAIAWAAEALRASRDRWVSAHRDELLAALTVAARRTGPETHDRLSAPTPRSEPTATAPAVASSAPSAPPAAARPVSPPAVAARPVPPPAVAARPAAAAGVAAPVPPPVVAARPAPVAPAAPADGAPVRADRRCRVEGNPYHHGTEGGPVNCAPPREQAPPRPPVESNPYRMI